MACLGSKNFGLLTVNFHAVMGVQVPRADLFFSAPQPSGGFNAVDFSCLKQCSNAFTSFPRRRETSFFKIFRIPAFAEMTWQNSAQILKSTALPGGISFNLFLFAALGFALKKEIKLVQVAES